MLGAHTPKSQKRKILAVVAAVGAVILVAVLVWPRGSQDATKQAQNAPGADVTTTTTDSVPTANGTTTTSTITAGHDVNPLLSTTPQSPGTGSVAVPPTTTTIPTPDTTSGVTTVPPGATVHYGAEVNPTFTQSPTDPLWVSYQATATASIVEDGQFVPRTNQGSANMVGVASLAQLWKLLPVGDTLTVIAIYSGVADWTGSQSSSFNYAMP